MSDILLAKVGTIKDLSLGTIRECNLFSYSLIVNYLK